MKARILSALMIAVFLVSVLAIAANAEQALASNGNSSGLVSKWHFDEQDGTTAYDSIGDNDGTLNGVPEWTSDGELGNALDFDGVGDYVAIPTFDFPNTFTIELWAKPEAVANEPQHQVLNGNGEFMQAVIGQTGTGDGHPGYWRAWIYVKNVGIQVSIYSLNTVTVGEWYHLAFVYDGTTAEFFVNFVSQGTASWSGPFSGANSAPQIGRHPSGLRHFDGVIDEVRIWSIALTADHLDHYPVNFEQTGSGVAPTVDYTIDSSPGSGTVPFTVWVEAGKSIWYDYQDEVLGSGVKYVETDVYPVPDQEIIDPLTVTATYETVILVDIDIKPGSDPNSINPGENGVLPVAILGSDTFDVTQIDPGTLRLGSVLITTRGSAKAPKTAFSIEDVDGDTYDDLVAFFRVQDLVNAGALDETTTELTLTGNLKTEFGGTPIEGTDLVRVVPP